MKAFAARILMNAELVAAGQQRGHQIERQPPSRCAIGPGVRARCDYDAWGLDPCVVGGRFASPPYHAGQPLSFANSSGCA